MSNLLTYGILNQSSAPVVNNDFIIRVKTDNAGTSNNDQFQLQLFKSSLYIHNAVVNWGDGSTTNIVGQSSSITHTYPSAGEYTVTITGTFPQIGYYNGGDKLKIIKMVNIGNVGFISLNQAFRGCTNMVMDVNSVGNLSSLKVAQQAFENCPLGYMPDVDMSNCTNFNQTFRGCGVFTDFKLRNFYAMTNGTFCFLSSTLPTSDYSDILITQNANNPNNSVTFHGGNSNYNASATIARTNLVSVKSWTITDAGLV